jgi:hypothetical protein
MGIMLRMRTLPAGFIAPRLGFVFVSSARKLAHAAEIINPMPNNDIARGQQTHA